jgi:hypothetical protein
VLDVACFESGGLSDLRRAAVKAHSRSCMRCGFSLADIRQARTEILGATEKIRTLRSRHAAEEIQNLLRPRMH